MSSDASVHDYLERMVPLQGAYTDNVDRLTEIKGHARSDGLNIEAVNALLPILVRNPYDKGATVLNEVIRYAEVIGTEGLVAKGDADAHASSARQASADVSQPAKGEAHSASGLGRRSTASVPLRLSAQVVAAMSVSIGLIWLLN